MSTFEITDLFATHITLTITIFMAFVSITSALLVATYFASNIISSTLARIVIIIYSTSSIFLISAFQRTSDVLIRLRGQFDESMSWHTASSEPTWVLPTLVSVGTLTLVGISVGTVWYFLQTRKKIEVEVLSKDRQSENPAD